MIEKPVKLICDLPTEPKARRKELIHLEDNVGVIVKVTANTAEVEPYTRNRKNYEIGPEWYGQFIQLWTDSLQTGAIQNLYKFISDQISKAKEEGKQETFKMTSQEAWKEFEQSIRHQVAQEIIDEIPDFSGLEDGLAYQIIEEFKQQLKDKYGIK